MTRTALLTGPVRSFERWRREVQVRGWNVQTLALIETVPIEELTFNDLGTPDWVVFTSDAALESVGRNARLATIPCAVVGHATAERARELGYSVQVVGPDESAKSLAAELGGRCRGARVLWCRGDLARELGQALGELGADVIEREVYRTRPAELSAEPAADAVFFASPSAVRAWAARWSEPAMTLAIGATTAEAIRAEGWRSPLVLNKPTPESLSRELRRG